MRNRPSEILTAAIFSIFDLLQFFRMAQAIRKVLRLKKKRGVT
jgi:hypothetical protein